MFVNTQLTMKRLVIALFIIAMLGMISPGLSAIGQPIHVPHENPATATGSLDKPALLLSYSKTINLATNQQYQNAQDVLNELRHTDIPDELQYIIDRHNNLCQQLFTTLDNLEILLDETSALLAQNQIQGAKQRLDYAEADIQDGSSLCEDIEAATDALSDKLGVFISPAVSQITHAYTHLEESLERLRELIDDYYNLRQSLTERYVQMMEFIPTELSLSINPASVFVGDNITVSGRLSSDGKPLSGRKLVLTLSSESTTANVSIPVITTTNTGFNGSYVTSITIPYRYVDTMTLIAVYGPSGDDTDMYLASKSPPVTINTMFYRTHLEVSTPEMAHQDLPLAISGRVFTTNGNVDRTIKVLLYDTQLAEEMVAGQFTFEITLPEQTLPGKHNLNIAVTPQGRYSGAAETRSINISILPIHIDIQAPTTILLPKTIQITGMVYHEFGPVADAAVSLNLKNSSTTVRTSPDGRFTTSLEAPLDLSFIGVQEITVDIEPLEPWVTKLSVKRDALTINPVSTGLILAILIALGLFIYRKSQTRVPQGKTTPQPEIIELPAITPVPKPKYKLTGIRGRVLSAYQSGLEAVEKITGVVMTPNITVREFLKMITLPSPTATEPFTELTTIAEITLYSEYSPREDTATRAERLATTIQEVLRRGAS